MSDTGIHRPVRSRRDDGSVLPLVLVMMVVSALVVIPLLTYAVSVLRANTVVSNATRGREAAEAGIRVALTDTENLFNKCQTDAAKPVPNQPAYIVDALDVTECSQIKDIGPLDLGRPQIAAFTTTQIGESIPNAVSGTPLLQWPEVPPVPLKTDWWEPTSAYETGRAWLPDLPPPPTTPRPADGYDMPTAFGCRVYLPGYYDAEIDIDAGNVYFASGVYYFEQSVRFGGDANVVVGSGLAELPNECANDVQVATYVQGNTTTLNIDGVGATWIFGDEGHLVVSDAATAGTASKKLSLQFNQRYADEGDPTGGVSIMSVNGQAGTSNRLEVPGVIQVPRSTVGGTVIGAQPAGPAGAGNGYRPSATRFTPTPRLPSAPSDVTATPATDATGTSGVAFVSWVEVPGDASGGSAVTAYTVRVGGTVMCQHPMPETPPAPPIAAVVRVDTEEDRVACVITNLPLDTPSSISVTATSAAGESPTADATVLVAPTATDIAYSAPVAPTLDDDAAFVTYRNAVGVSWSASPPGAAGEPVTGYRVTAYRVWIDELSGNEAYAEAGSCTTEASFDASAATSCVVTELATLPLGNPGELDQGYRFVVQATNAPNPIATPIPNGYTSAESAPSGLFLDLTGGEPPLPDEPSTPSPVTAVVPDPLIDIDVSNLDADVEAIVSINGYVSVPMGRIKIDNPRHSEVREVRLAGGVLTGSLDLLDDRADAPAGTLPIGMRDDIVLQRQIKVTGISGETTVTAVVEINADFEYRINSWVVR